MTMTTATAPSASTDIDRDSTPGPTATHARRRELIDLHTRAGQLVAELSTGPTWTDAEHITVRLIAEAQAVTPSATPTATVATPAVVRCRELAAAQRHMVVALDGGHRLDVDDAAVVRARALLAELTELAAGQRATLRR